MVLDEQLVILAVHRSCESGDSSFIPAYAEIQLLEKALYFGTVLVKQMRPE